MRARLLHKLRSMTAYEVAVREVCQPMNSGSCSACLPIIFCAPSGWVNDNGSGEASCFTVDEESTVSVGWI